MSTTKSDESDSDEIDDNYRNNNIISESDEESKQIVKMVFRKPVATTPISILIESLVKNLCTMIEIDEQRAKKMYINICNKLFEMKLIDESYQMTEFEGVRSQYQKALYHLVAAARNTEDPVTVLPTSWPNFNSDWSHYQREFDEIEYIAGGGFGQVFRVRHKLDGSEYAVKKIYIRSNGIRSVKNYLSEVKTFASLNHSNIVQYKAAWLELGIPSSTKKAIELIDDVSSFSNENETNAHNSEEHYHTHFDSFSNESLKKDTKDTSEFIVEFETRKSKHFSYSNNNLSSSKSGKRQQRRNRSRNSISEGGKAICKFNVEDARGGGFESSEHKWATLYIQMSLCQITLKQWLETRNENEKDVTAALVRLSPKVHRETIIDIFQQLLRGVQYIHSKRVVHHDIKPSNIFLQMDGGVLCVQLGDFGLACPLQNSQHSLALGTKLYAAPEQLNGKCDPKSDMYSLGIVLLELVEAFGTDMERVEQISELRKGRLSRNISAQDPQLAHIISQLVTNVPHLRPEPSELLNRLVEPTAEAEEIRHLKDQLKERDIEIDKLKKMLKNVGINY